MGKSVIKKKENTITKKKNKVLKDLNLLESVNVKGLSDIEMCHAYVSRATEFENDFKPNKALVFYNKCIEILNPKSAENKDYLDNLIKCLEASAYILIDLDRKEEARERLLKVTVLNPNVGYEKYMFLAQLSDGENAVNLYDKGIYTIENEIRNSASDTEKVKKLSFDLSQSYCALAEIYMTDLCDNPDAEEKCKEYVEKSKKTCPDNAQSYLIAASFATVKANNEEAKSNLKKCLELWWPPVNKFLDEQKTETDKKESKMDDEDDEDNEDEGGQIDLEELTGIPFQAHISMAKNLYEVEMYQEAVDVLEVILEEDDEDPEIYYLLSHAGSKLNWKEEDPDKLRYFATICKVISTKMQDQEVCDEMNKILEGLPEPKDDEMGEFEIPDTDEDSDEYETMDEDEDSDEDSDADYDNKDDNKESEEEMDDK